MALTKLFISHATEDKPLVKAFVDLIVNGIGVDRRHIFCTSLKGQGIEPGERFEAYIRNRLDEATCAVALISPNFYSSSFCMCELGGIWLQAKSFLPVLVPPVHYDGLKAVLEGLQVLRIAQPADLDSLRDEIEKRLKIKTTLGTPAWNERRDDFLAELPALLKELPNNAAVPKEVHDKALKELSEYKTAYTKQGAEIRDLKATIAKLKQLKDARQVASLIQDDSDEAKVFEELVSAARDALKPLPQAVCQALYYRIRNEDYRPNDRELWEDVQSHVENGQLEYNSTESGVLPRRSDPKVRKAIEALDRLEQWLENRNSADFEEWYEAQYETTPDCTLRPFWKTHLGMRSW